MVGQGRGYAETSELSLHRLHTLEALISKGRPIPIWLTQILITITWRCSVLATTLTVTEVEEKKRATDPELSVRHPIYAGLSAIQLSDPHEIVNAFKQAKLSELKSMKLLRERNSCAERSEGSAMLDCELCREKSSPASSVTMPGPVGNTEAQPHPHTLRDIQVPVSRLSEEQETKTSQKWQQLSTSLVITR